MSLRINIEKILESPESIFKEILTKLIAKNITDAKKELSSQYRGVDTVLFDAINLLLTDLKNEEGYISRLLYRLFKIEIKRNVRREQLIILGSQLKAHYRDIKKDIYRLKLYIYNITSTIKNLERLKKAFKDKNMFIFEQSMLEKSNYYIGRINSKIKELEYYKSSLEDKLKIVEKDEKSHKTLFKKIPRYYELNEEIYLQLN
jgi:hypothetical protein